MRSDAVKPEDQRAAGRMVVRALGLPAQGTAEFDKAEEMLEMLGIKPYQAHARSTKAGEP